MAKSLVFVCVLSIALFLFGKEKTDSLIYFDAGIQEKISTEKLPAVLDVFDKIIDGTDDVYRLIVTSEHIRELKDKKRGIEIVLSKTRRIRSETGTKEADRLLLLFCSEPVCEGGTAVFYLGKNGKYMTPPFISSNGGAYIDRMKKLIGK